MPLKQKKFVANYILLAGNGVRAVYAAGYKQGYNAACVTSSRLLRKAKVSEQIEKHANKAQMSANGVIEELSDIAQVKTEIDGNQRLKALELLGKFHKLFVDRSEIVTTDSNSLSKDLLLRRIDKLSAKTGRNPRDIALELQSGLSDKTDEDYSPELDRAISEVVSSFPATDNPIEIGDQ